MCLKIILKSTKNQGLTLSFEDTFSEKQRKRWREGGDFNKTFENARDGND